MCAGGYEDFPLRVSLARRILETLYNSFLTLRQMDSSWSHEVAISKFGSLFNDYQRLLDERDKQIFQLKERIELLLTLIEKAKLMPTIIEDPDIPLTE